MAKPVRRALLAAVFFLALTGVVYLLFVALGPERDSRRRQGERFAFLRLGMPRDGVLREAGRPDQICRGGEPVRLLKGQTSSEGAGAHDENHVLQRLEGQTAEVLVYYFPKESVERRRVACGPAYLDTAIGLDSTGNVLWFTILRGEDMVRYARTS